jgi:hypothetical protein
MGSCPMLAFSFTASLVVKRRRHIRLTTVSRPRTYKRRSSFVAKTSRENHVFRSSGAAQAGSSSSRGWPDVSDEPCCVIAPDVPVNPSVLLARGTIAHIVRLALAFAVKCANGGDGKTLRPPWHCHDPCQVSSMAEGYTLEYPGDGCGHFSWKPSQIPVFLKRVTNYQKAHRESFHNEVLPQPAPHQSPFGMVTNPSPCVCLCRR